MDLFAGYSMAERIRFFHIREEERERRRLESLGGEIPDFAKDGGAGRDAGCTHRSEK